VGVYRDQFLPRFVNAAMASDEFTQIRARVASDLAGEVLEVGFGSGLNVPLYPSTVSRVRAVDPATLGRKLAASRINESPIPIDFVGLDGEDLPLDADTIDHVLVTWTLCTIPEAGRALREVRRVLRPGGQLHFVEHGRSPELGVARWQDRLTPLQRRLFGGCHLNRLIDTLVADSGFEIKRIERFYVRGPKPWGYMFEGVATKT
jgi:ubiquinone/menaquinone biosynthesis C-methylase UbiE